WDASIVLPNERQKARRQRLPQVGFHIGDFLSGRGTADRGEHEGGKSRRYAFGWGRRGMKIGGRLRLGLRLRLRGGPPDLTLLDTPPSPPGMCAPQPLP